MGLLYGFILRFFLIGVRISAIRNKKAKKWLAGRKNLFERIEQEVDQDAKIAWFHCASLGEFEQGRPVIEKFRERYSDYRILLTFFSPSGYEIRKNYENADYIYYLPIDLKRNARKFVHLVNPKVVFFVKYEYWINYIKEIYHGKIPLFLVSGIFRENQLFFKWHGKFYRRLLEKFKHLFVQNRESQHLLENISIRNVSICGDTRFDRVLEVAIEAKEINEIEHFKQGKRVLIAGSTWPRDEELLVEYINQCKHDIKFIIAPHEVKSENITRICQSIKDHTVKFSEIKNSSTSDAKVLVIDNIGLLSSIYRYGEIAFIGGAFGKGLHNILEAATFGLPVIFGPNYKNFNEAVELVKQKGAFEVINYNEFYIVVEELLINHDFFNNASKTCKGYVQGNSGATVHILNYLESKQILN